MRWQAFIRERIGEGSQASLAHALGLSPGAVSSWAKYGQVPLEKTIRKGVKKLGGDLLPWLEAAEYAQVLPSPASRPEAVSEATGAYTPRPSTASLPVAGELQAGTVLEVEEERGEIFPCLEEHARLADYVVRVSGWSMYPTLQPGDFVAVKRSRIADSGDIVVAKRGSETYLKRYGGRRAKRVTLTSDNPEYESIEGEDIEIVGIYAWQHRTRETARKAKAR